MVYLSDAAVSVKFANLSVVACRVSLACVYLVSTSDKSVSSVDGGEVGPGICTRLYRPLS